MIQKLNPGTATVVRMGYQSQFLFPERFCIKAQAEFEDLLPQGIFWGSQIFNGCHAYSE